jgi:formylglycine-generating enzyme required for sulfatase activity
MGTTVQKQHAKVTYDAELRGVGANYPMYYVSWDDIQAFIQKLNEKEKEKGDQAIFCRLPTEAEWEYAARAGSSTLYHFGDDAAQLGEYAWYDGNAGRTTHPVGEKKPNAWGLYDMHGSVWEWVQDRYDKAYYQNSPNVDPKGPDAGSYRVIRGGGWGGPARVARSADRYGGDPGFPDFYRGFRCAMSIPSK